MANFSFDIVSEVDFQEVDNAINQAKKELDQRYDFKGSKASIEYNRAEKKITLVGDDDYKLRALQDMIRTRAAKRGLSLKSFDFQEPQKAFEGSLRQIVAITSGIPKDRAKELVKLIKDMNIKVQPQIEGEKVRVVSAKKDFLQEVMTRLRAADFPLALDFNNYR